MKPYYSDDAVTIYHGDCRDVLPDIGGIDCTVTSPPYNTLGARVPTSPTGMHANSGWVANIHATGYADDMDEVEYAEWQADVARAIRSSTTSGGSFFYNHKLRSRDGVSLHPLHIVATFEGWAMRQELIWLRPGAVQFNARMFAPNDERIYWLYRDDGPHKWNQDAAVFLSVWAMSPPTDLDGHPCPYPITLPTRCISATTDPGDLVFDPFMGTGTTLRAAKDLNRRAIGCDISEAYCEIAAKRMAQEVLDFGGAAS